MCGLVLSGTMRGHAAPLPPAVQFTAGPVNSLQIGQSILVYGAGGQTRSGIQQVLFTHARRDVVWAGLPQVQAGAKAIVPQLERDRFEQPGTFWAAFQTRRFHDYAQISTKVPTSSMPVTQAVRGGDVLDLNGVSVSVLDTPGYTPGAVSYLFEVEGKRIACIGDLMYGDGQLFDLYSLQDAIPAAKARGYHGYAARAGALIASLRRVAAARPHVLVPARGPLIENPQAAIRRLISRVQALMQSHFSTDALLWYWGEDNLKIRSRDVLDGAPVQSMPMAAQRELPDWATAIENSRLLVSRSGAAFLVDAGYSRILPELLSLQQAGRFRSLEGIWVTHYHDDHTDHVQDVAQRFRSPVYAVSSMEDILRYPERYRMPCLTTNGIRNPTVQPHRSTLSWREFQLTYYEFPGQTLYHGGLLVRPDSGPALFFVGDSFTPSGMDDYCLQNRDFLHDDQGYLYCLGRLEQLPADHWLINQHVRPMFRFSREQITRMRREMRRRASVIRELCPFPDPNYAVDESWARFYPYGTSADAGALLTLTLKILNHSPQPETYRITWHVPADWQLAQPKREVTIPARQEGAVHLEARPQGSGLKIVTADIAFRGFDLRHWTEAMVDVRAERV